MLDLLNRKNNVKRSTIDPCYTRLTPVDDEKNGVIVKSSEFKESRVADGSKQFNYKDFNIGNILATGSEQLLKPCSMRNTDVVGIAEKLDSINEQFNSAQNV